MKRELKFVIPAIIITVVCVVIVFSLCTNQLNGTSIDQKTPGNENQKNISNLTFPAQHISLRLQTSIDKFVINAIVPETPQSIPLYRGIIPDEDLGNDIKYSSSNLSRVKSGVPSETEAPVLAQQALEPYGGFPADAVLSISHTSYAIEQKSTGEVVAQYPIMTSVSYSREINGMPVVGHCDGITIDLGENGELLLLIKTWRMLENTGQNVSVISPQEAIEKLQQGDTLNKLQSSNDVLIDSIKLGYFEKSKELREIILEPCWIFSGNTSSGSQIRLFVYARQFANFTATPTYGRAPLTVFFTDTSDASPSRWNWDFGDGTNYTEKNPVHVYQTPGKYNISMRVWNDLGSDTSTKYDDISVLAIGDT